MAVATLFAGCRIRGGGPPEKPLDDATLASRVRSRIAADPLLKGFEITVSAAGGRMSLTGAVGSERARRRATELAYSAGDVSTVANRLIIKK